jgi:hypothetical protein
LNLHSFAAISANLSLFGIVTAFARHCQYVQKKCRKFLRPFSVVSTLSKRMNVPRPPLRPTQPFLKALSFATLITGNLTKTPDLLNVLHQDSVLMKRLGRFTQCRNPGFLLQLGLLLQALLSLLVLRQLAMLS